MARQVSDSAGGEQGTGPTAPAPAGIGGPPPPTEAGGAPAGPSGFVRRRLLASGTQKLIFWATAAVVAYLVLGPLAITGVATFTPQGQLPLSADFYTLDNYREVFTSGRTYVLMWNTMAFTLGALSLGLSLALLFSWLVERTDMPLRNVSFAIIIAPMAIPGLLAAIAWVFLLDPTVGLVNQIVRTVLFLDVERGPINVYSLGGMIFIEGVRMVPTIFLMTSAAFRTMDPELEEASRVARATSWGTVRKITLPLMFPAVLAAGLYYVIVIIESFDVPGVIGMSAGRHVFSTAIYRAAAPPGGGLPDYGMASTLGLVLVAIAVVAIWLYQKATANARKFVTISGKGYRPRRIPLGRWRYPALAVCALYFLVALGLPLFILLWRSLQPHYIAFSLSAIETLTLNSYRQVIAHPTVLRAFSNTLLLALLTATATMALAFMVGWFTARQRTRAARLLDLMTFVPHAIASIVIALGVLLIYLSFPNPIYGTVYIIALAGVTRYISYATRVMNAGILQIDPALEEVSRICGTGWFKTYARIVFPLVLPVLMNGWIWVAVHAARELSAALMLYTPGSIVVSTQIWVLWEGAGAGTASAMGVVLIVTLMVVTWLGRLVVARRAKL